MPHIIKWKIPNKEVYTRPFTSPSQHQPIKSLIPFITSMVLLCLSFSLSTYLISFQPYLNDYFKQRNKKYEVNSHSLESTILWSNLISLPLMITAFVKYGSVVRNSILFFLSMLSCGLCFISSFYYSFGYFCAIVGIFAGFGKSFLSFYPFVLAREVVEYKNKSLITGVLYGLVFGIEKLISWILSLIVNYHNEGEKYEKSPYFKSFNLKSIKSAMVAIRVMIVLNFLMAVAAYFIFVKTYGHEAVDNDKLDSLVKFEEIQDYEPPNGVNPYLRRGQGTTPEADPQELTIAENSTGRIFFTIYQFFFNIAFSICLYGLIDSLNKATPWYEGWSYNTPQVKKFEVLVILITSYLFSRNFKSGFSIIFIPLLVLLTQGMFELNPKFSDKNDDNLPIFVISWILLKAIEVIYDILTINLICRYNYDYRYMNLTILWMVRLLIQAIVSLGYNTYESYLKDIRIESREIIAVMILFIFYGSAFYSAYVWSLADPDDGLLLDIYGGQTYKASGEKNLD